MSSSDPYAAPSAPLERPPTTPQRFLSPKALLLGAGVDFGLTLVGGIALASYYLAQGWTPEEIAAATHTPASIALGSLASVAGGYVAGRSAGYAGLRHGFFATALLSLFFAVLSLVTGDASEFRSLELALTGLTLVCGAIGGALWERSAGPGANAVDSGP